MTTSSPPFSSRRNAHLSLCKVRGACAPAAAAKGLSVFPLSKVQQLSDYEGKFLLSVQCVACKHERAIAATSLAHRMGKTARVTDVVRRMRCSKCGGRRVEVAVSGIPR